MSSAQTGDTKGCTETCCAKCYSIFLGVFLALTCVGFYGCGIAGYIPPERLSYEKLSAGYRQTRLKISSTLDVLGRIRSAQYGEDANSVKIELLSQSDTIIASSGQSKNGRKSWFTMVAFDEHTMTARRKYFLCIDEKAEVTSEEPQHYLIPPRRALMFDGEIILPQELFQEPYATEEARLVAMLKHFPENLKQDIQEVSAGTDELSNDNKILTVSGMLMNQVFEAALLELNQSVAAAKELGSKDGVEFSHMNFNKCRIRMTAINDIVTVKIRLGIPMQ